MELHGQTAVVTGGGRGLGRAFAQALGAAGAEIVAIARTQDELDETVLSIGPKARAYCADVTDEASIREVFRQLGPVDLLVNNAGVLGPIGPFAETGFDRWWDAMNVNLRGAMLCTHAVLPGMLERGRGRIVNVVTGAFSAAYLSAYLTSKTALVRATECLAMETASSGVALFSIAPGTVRTSMTSRSLLSPDGQRWIPWYRRIYDEGLDLPAARPAALVVALASGKYAALSGLYLTSYDDLDAMLRQRAEIEKGKLHILQLRPLQGSAHAAAINSIREAAIREAAIREAAMYNRESDKEH